MKPKDINENDEFFIKKFPNLSESVRSYLKNINTHLAYDDFREERKKLRMSGENLSGYKLVNFLKDYSERRESYIKDVKEIISSNNFQKYDKGNVLN